ncbi:murein DD-endopeptidase MepM/ murein hydrolase activator NlpD [Streptomyces umbrinus]|uniref:Murein DD-endopeptidase MepM/ murein hydrolase activator NlpD n=1 Tax=Streptomyces umbrinus TaxID=67370 RepID=A0ABU0SQN5_9ACTN|nr:M23 family metallopeptidase [Streptomyces umbrinus]MDQ1025797.1 murein DD-endopeptidase MepM/ murein hydrolase activator NlpD [Streptomyces umbrinus]
MREDQSTRTWLTLLPALTVALMVAAVGALGAALPTATALDGGPGGGPSGGPGGSSPPAPPAVPAPPADTPVPAVGRAWPVGLRPSVIRGWEPPATTYGRGHRGVDLAANPGTPVRAVAPGRVSFAGRVAGRGVVSVELNGTGDPPLRTTYEPVRATAKKGAVVAAGEVIGVLEPTGSHCPASCLHWGLRRADTYLDPLSLLPPWLLGRGPSRLLPVIGVPESEVRAVP